MPGLLWSTHVSSATGSTSVPGTLATAAISLEPVETVCPEPVVALTVSAAAPAGFPREATWKAKVIDASAGIASGHGASPGRCGQTSDPM